jgi:HlyD family secretion protein
VDVGQTVAASFQTPTLFTIAQDLKDMQIYTTVAEADVGGVKVGQPVHFTVDAFPERTFPGTVKQIRLNSQVLQNVVTYNVVIDVDNAEEILLPGMTAFVSIEVAERKDVLKLPLAALRFKPSEEPKKGPGRKSPAGEKTVYRPQNGGIAQEKVQVGILDGKFAELLSGNLREGDKLVVEDLGQKKPDAAAPGGAGGFRMRMF